MVYFILIFCVVRNIKIAPIYLPQGDDAKLNVDSNTAVFNVDSDTAILKT
jgi:hypothetical protein